ncbi:MAG TPA: putative nucleotidyltransferase substrate binding domain-containing protein [Kineosporiaceae bacterium]
MNELVTFLRGQPPYDALDPAELGRLAATAEERRFTRGAMIVATGDSLPDHLWVVRSGSVEVLDQGRLVDQLVEGDTFGHTSTLSGTPPRLTVRAAEDTVCYRLPDPRGVLDHPDRLRYAPYGSAALRVRARLPVSRYARPLVRCDAGTPVREVARRIGEARQSCALVIFPDGVGIVTDVDFRRRVATGEVGVEEPIHRIASRPVRAVGDDVLVATAFAEMLEHGVHHLVVLDGGGRPAGVVRVVDLSPADLRDPLVVRAAVDAASTRDELAEACRMLPATAVGLWDAGIPAVQLAPLLSAVLDAAVRRLLELDRDVVAARLGPWRPALSWIVLGSLARREVLPGSDVDTALVWADPDDPGAAADPDDPGAAAADPVAVRVLGAAREVIADLGRIGLEPCPDGANADSPRFARSVSGWRAATRRWLRDPDSTQDAFLLSTMLADSRPLTEPELGRAVTEGLLHASRSPQFMRLLLQYCLSARPPTGFVRDFVVEHTGEHRGQLNLKRRGLRPVTSLGRWVAVATGDASGGTVARLRRGAEAGLLTQDEADTLAAAHDQIFALVLHREIDALRAGARPDTYLAPDTLDSLTRRYLRESFRAIAHVQNRLESLWTNRTGG